MHPANVPCITAAGIDCCALANNHILDWGMAGLVETLDTLGRAGVSTVGAGRDLDAAAAPAALDIGGSHRVLVFAFGVPSSGILPEWAAAWDRPGVQLLPDLSRRSLCDVAQRIQPRTRNGDIVIASIHWGGNWGYEIASQARAFAHGLIDRAGVTVVHGHSSHHPKGIEIYRGRPIFYGCGDLLNDYEGIPGYERFRDDLVAMYFPTIDPSANALVRLAASVFQIRRFRLNRASKADKAWMRATLSREGTSLGTAVEPGPDDDLVVTWR
jgi:poly-gamma-glutamate synthesis protein (capsule biosynthesis protein)